MLTATVNEKYTCTANTLTALKRKASMLANRTAKVIDTMYVTFPNGEYRFIRINKKAPWGEIQRGQWR